MKDDNFLDAFNKSLVQGVHRFFLMATNCFSEVVTAKLIELALLISSYKRCIKLHAFYLCQGKQVILLRLSDLTITMFLLPTASEFCETGLVKDFLVEVTCSSVFFASSF